VDLVFSLAEGDKESQVAIRKFQIAPASYDEKAVLNAFSQISTQAENKTIPNLVNDFETALGSASDHNRIILPMALIAATETPKADNANGLSDAVASNSVTVDSVVDYTKQYFLNVTSYPFTSSTSNFELNADGTLSKGGATIDTTKLADVIPLNSYLSKVVEHIAPKVAVAAGLAGAAAVPRYKIQLSISEQGYQYTLTKISALTVSSLASCSNPALTFGTDLWTRAPLGGAASDDGKADKSKQYLFQGTVTPPKPDSGN
jgi:hypothetical protein